MKKLLSVSIAALAFAAVADYQPITVGVTTITPTTQNTIIPVPYTSIGSSADVSVHDLVKAANLPTGTMLCYFDGAGYTAWKKNASGAWDTPEISTLGGVDVAPESSTITVSVGSALWIVFPDDTTLNQQSIVVYGSPAAVTNSTIVANKINLLANPTTVTVSGSTLATKLSAIAQVKDTILPIGESFAGSYVYGGAENGWVHIVPNSNGGTGSSYVKNAPLPDLAANQGFWYVSKTAGPDKEIAW
jgi:hypothetical protein